MRRTPKLHLVGRAYSEMSPLNPDPLPESPTTSNAGQDRRGEQGGYGSMFPFGLLRGSFGRGGNANQVGSAQLRGRTPHMLRILATAYRILLHTFAEADCLTDNANGFPSVCFIVSIRRGAPNRPHPSI